MTMRTRALVLAFFLAAALLCHGAVAVAKPASIAADELVMAGMELRRPMIDSMMTANWSAAEQPSPPTAGSDGVGRRLRLNWFSLLSEVTSPLARDHPFVQQGIVLDHLLVFLVVFVVYNFG